MIILIQENGIKRYFKDNYLINFHNDYGPAIKSNIVKRYYKLGKKHNCYGPTSIYTNGDKYFYLLDVEYKYQEWKFLTKNFFNL